MYDVLFILSCGLPATYLPLTQLASCIKLGGNNGKIVMLN